ncbi:MAG: ABC transporter permease [Planctomycetaceae bacterium]|nr:ABC transporter permease [Planctomycetota bacterium]NUN51920.1 ABC transporter permease [Planctomycetaceae bacterium]
MARKELLHVLRDPTTLFVALFIPVLQLVLLGYAIDTNVRHIRTAVLDEARTQESRALVRSFENTGDFDVAVLAADEEELHRALVSGRARVGIRIPEDWSRRLLSGDPAPFLLLVDGSESAVAGQALGTANAVALRESLARLLGDRPLPVEVRPRVLFNPDTRSANFFVPGLMVVLTQIMAVMLTATSVVREKEQGTLEQLAMTPARPGEIVAGKAIPYLFLAVGEFCAIAAIMVGVFRVPIHGSFGTLLLVALPFVTAMLAVGLLVSTLAATREGAMQMAMGTVIPSIFLSGYVFPLDSMPAPFRALGYCLPTTWLIDASRGVILRGAGWAELWPNAAVLSGMAALVLLLAALRFPRSAA